MRRNRCPRSSDPSSGWIAAAPPLAPPGWPWVIGAILEPMTERPDDDEGALTASGLEVRVRSARPGDVPRLVALLEGGALVAGREDPSDLGPYEAALEEIQASPGGDVLVVEHSGGVIGMCQLIVFRHFGQRGTLCAELESVHVDASFRGQGVGTVLLASAMARAAEAGCQRVQLTSNKARTDAHRFYVTHGFAQIHEGFKRPLG